MCILVQGNSSPEFLVLFQDVLKRPVLGILFLFLQPGLDLFLQLSVGQGRLMRPQFGRRAELDLADVAKDLLEVAGLPAMLHGHLVSVPIRPGVKADVTGITEVVVILALHLRVVKRDLLEVAGLPTMLHGHLVSVPVRSGVEAGGTGIAKVLVILA